MKTETLKLSLTLAGVLALAVAPARSAALDYDDPRNQAIRQNEDAARNRRHAGALDQPAADQRDTKGYMKFLKDTEVFVVLPGRSPVRWTVREGYCAPLLAFESKKRSQYVSNSVYYDQAVLKWGKATITISLGSRHSSEPPLTGNAVVALVPAADSETGSARYREGFKEFLAYIAERQRAEDAAETNARLESLQNELTEQRRQLEQQRQRR